MCEKCVTWVCEGCVRGVWRVCERGCEGSVRGV